MSPVADPRELFDLRLERVRLKVLRALVAGDAERDAARLAVVERTLAEVRGARDQRLAALLGLGSDEVDLLWFVVALSADPMVGPHAVALAGSDARRGATLALYGTVMELPAARTRALALALGPAHPFLRLGLLEPGEPDQVMAMSSLRASRRLVRHLCGDDSLDEGLAPAGDRVAIPSAPAWDQAAETAHASVARTLANGDSVLVWVEGPAGVGRRTLLACAARGQGRGAVALDLARLPPTPSAWSQALLALRREHTLSGDLPILAGLGVPSPENDGEARFRLAARFIDETEGAVAVVADEGEAALEPSRAVLRVSLPVPDAELRRTLWRTALGATTVEETQIEDLSVRYRLGVGGIGRAVAAARLAARARGAAAPSAPDLAHGVRVSIHQRMGDLARKVEITQDWDDLILGEDARAQLDGLIQRVRHAYQVLERWGFRKKVARGGGLAALFSGPPGTGKTMAAGLVARALDLHVYQVDLGAVVSKWVGETEKNLSRLFEAADAGHALLLFDEADALFAKRTEVRGAQDRHANLEVNHLLQRIEAFGGIAVLTTNLDASLDPALRRRLAAHISFEKPSTEERATLWERLLAGPAPRAADIDTKRLARQFSAMAGAHIRNAVVAAAFRAAAEAATISQEHLERAAADEYRAMGRIYMEKKS